MRTLRAVVLSTAAALTLAACAPSNQEAIELSGITAERANDPVIPTGPGGEISVEAGDLFFQNLEGTPVDGAISVTLENIGDAEHNVRIDRAAGDQLKVSALGGETVTGELLLFGQAGGQEYVYYCDIPGHREAGMEGTLIVYLTAEEAQEGPIGTTEPVG